MPADAPREVVSRGRSMYPLLRDGSRVLLDPVDAAALQPGRIVAFERDGAIVLHRVLRKEQRADGWWVREKGDNNRFSTWVPGHALLGVAREARDAAGATRLDADVGDLRVRALTALSRAEAWLGDRAARAGDGRGPTWRTPLFVALTLPLRVPALALLTAYPRTAAEESPRGREAVLALYRHLATGEGAAPAYDEGLLRLAVAHGLESLWAAGASGVPDLQRMRHRAGFQYLSLVTALRQTRAALDGAAVPFVVLKGPPLAMRAYGDGAARVGFDIDILVRRGDRERAAAALAAAGFRCRSGAVASRLIKRGHFHLVFDPPARVNALVELHWDLVDRANLYRLDEADAWDGVRADASCGVPVGILAPERELVYLCLHAAKHGFLNGAALRSGVAVDWFARPESGNRLIWFLDLARLAERQPTDWARVAEISRRWNVGEPVFQTLEIAARLAPSPALATALEALRDLRPAAAGSAAVPVERLARWMKPNKTFVVRPARLLELKSLFFPGRERLRAYYGLAAPWRLLTHPFHMLRRLAGG